MTKRKKKHSEKVWKQCRVVMFVLLLLACFPGFWIFVLTVCNDLSVPSSPAAPVMLPAPISLTTWMKQVWKIRKTSKTTRTPPSSTSPPSSTCLWLSSSQRESPSESRATKTVRLIFFSQCCVWKEISVSTESVWTCQTHFKCGIVYIL